MRKHSFISCCFALVLVFSLPGCSWFSRAKAVIIHPQKTGITTLKFRDEARNRPLITEIWYPVDDEADAKPVSGLWVRCQEARDAPLRQDIEKRPLVVMSHGNGGDRMNNAWIAEMLASNGYIVAAVDHHGNTWNNQIAENFIKIWERPQDISSLIDELTKHPVWGERIDSSRIGFVGYSLGGQTGVWVAGGLVKKFDKPNLSDVPKEQIPAIVTPELIAETDFTPATYSYRDGRVSAAFLMAPALGNLFDEKSLQEIEIPVYIVAPEADEVVLVEKSAKILAQQIRKVFFTLIPGQASHYVFLNEVSKGGKMMLSKAIANDHPTVNRKKIHEEVGVAAVQFFEDHLAARD